MRGIFLVKATHGYDVIVDEVPYGIDVSWSAAFEVATSLAKKRPPGDGRGFARCAHGGGQCFNLGVCKDYR